LRFGLIKRPEIKKEKLKYRSSLKGMNDITQSEALRCRRRQRIVSSNGAKYRYPQRGYIMELRAKL